MLVGWLHFHGKMKSGATRVNSIYMFICLLSIFFLFFFFFKMFVKVSAFYWVLIISFCGVLLADKTSFNSFMPSLTPIHYMHNLCLHAHARTCGARSCARAHTRWRAQISSACLDVSLMERRKTCSRQVWGSNNDGPKTTPSTAVAGAGTRGGEGGGTPGPRDGGFVAQKASGGLPTVDV